MNKSLPKIFGFLISLLFFNCQLGISQSIIHFQNWEGQPGAGNWVGFLTTDNNFTRGTDAAGVYKGAKAIYITNAGGTYGYDETVADEAYISKEIDFPSSASLDVELTFTWKCVGEIFGGVVYDYMKVYLVDETLVNPTESAIAAHPGTVIPLNGGAEFYGQNTFTTYNETLPTSIEGRTDLQLVFTWTNDNTATNGLPAAIDDIIISLGPAATSLAGDYLVGSDASAYFPTLTDATYFLNSYGVTNDVRFLLTDATYDNTTEYFPIVINDFNSSPPSASANSYTFTLQPNTAVQSTITGSVAGDVITDGTYQGLITINEADNVIINGSNNNTTTQDLTIINTNTLQDFGIFIGSNNPNYNENITVKNCIIEAAEATASISACLIAIHKTFTAANGGFDNLLVQNNTFRKADYGLYLDGGVAGDAQGLNVVVENNDLEQAGVNSLKYLGMYLKGLDNLTVSDNQIGNFDGSQNEQDYGMFLGSGTTNATIESNKIHDLAYSGTAGFAGTAIRIATATSPANILVKNNVIYGLSGDGNDLSLGATYVRNPMGIFLSGTQTGIDIYNNAIYLSGNTLNTAGAGSSCLYLGAGSTADIRNNVLMNELGLLTTVGLGSFGIIAFTGAAQFEDIGYNDYFSNASGSGINYTGRVGASDYTTLAAWKAAVIQDKSSISADPAFTSTSNLLPDTTNAKSWYVNGTGVQITTVAEDIRDSTRSVAASTGAPDMGAYEITPGAVPENAAVTGSHTLSGTEIFTVANRAIAEITWGGSGTLPTINFMKYYSGKNPENIKPQTAEYMNCYFDINAVGGSGYSYSIKFYYDSALFGGVSSETNLRLSKNDGSGWTTYDGISPEITSNSITVAGLSTFSSFTGSDLNNPLPVELMYFSGSLTELGYLLEWETASESNNDYFQIERSADGKNYEIVGVVEGHGTSLEQHYYSSIDGHIVPKVVFFRLRQVDYDGKETLSKIISIKPDRKTHYFKLYPNPANDYIKINSDLSLNNSTFRIFTISGNLLDVSSYKVEEVFGEVTIKLLDLSKGLYLLEINQNGRQELIKFIKE